MTFIWVLISRWGEQVRCRDVEVMCSLRLSGRKSLDLHEKCPFIGAVWWRHNCSPRGSVMASWIGQGDTIDLKISFLTSIYKLFTIGIKYICFSMTSIFIEQINNALFSPLYTTYHSKNIVLLGFYCRCLI